MREREKKLIHERLLKVLAYDPETGVFTWLAKRGGKAKAGAVAGVILRDGDRGIRIDGVRYDALRLAYFYVHGSWPAGAAIPADGDLDNARIANIRVAPEISPAELPQRRSDLTVELIRKLFFYEGGRLFWARHCGGTPIHFGMEAGCKSPEGYRVIKIGGISYRAHQIAWAHHHGEWLAEKEPDHENRIKDDNRISNLRAATHAQNAANIGPRRKPGNTGTLGVYRRKTRYHAYVSQKYIGSFADIDQAIQARQATAKERWGEFARG